MINYEAIENCVKRAGEIVLNADLNNADVEKKAGDANFCTEYDIKVQKFLIEELSVILPEATFFGEEETSNNSRDLSSEYVFYIDPIDGTTNFMFNYGHSSVSVGLCKNGNMIGGFVYNPFQDKLYKAIRNEGAFLNGKKLEPEDLSVSEGIVAFGCARYNECDVDILFETVKDLFLKSLSIRSGGSAAIDISRVAEGSNVIYLEYRLQPYDFAAASVIIEEAGGVITKVGGGKISLTEPCSILAGTKKAHAEVMKIAKEKRYNSEF
ncbi:MAG: inositol monophosphatase [Clostridia bacterium]|nr:inositol monophosphatase [Clostridia bacterium]